MRFDGVLARWNDDRGFGFIKPIVGGDEVFVHISEFPRDGRRPCVGERVSFEVAVDAKGKKKAHHLLCLDRTQQKNASSSADRRRTKPLHTSSHSLPHFLKNLVSAGLLLIILAIAYTQFEGYQRRRDLANQPNTQALSLSSSSANTSHFKCDGRTHCSQMTSCEEATFFINNCPGTKMDGNRDGVPCEQQWCTLGR